MTQVTIPSALGGDGLPFSDDGTSARDMQGQGYAANFFPMVAQAMGAVQVGVQAAGAIATASTNTNSTTNLTIGTGAKALTVETGKALVPGMWVLLAYRADPDKNMTGQVTSYDAATGALVLNITAINGAGTYADWAGSVTGAPPSFASPIGTITSVAKTPPTDGTWLECDSSVYLQSSYAALYAELGLIADMPSAAGTVIVSAYSGSNTLTGICWSGLGFLAAGGTDILNMGAVGSGTTLATHGGTGLTSIVSDGNGLVIAAGTSGTGTVRSTDSGATWAAGGTIVLGAGRNGAYGNGQFVFVGNATCATTSNGVTYTTRPFAGNGLGVTHAGGANWAALLNTGAVVLSADNGATWGSSVATGLTAYSVTNHNGVLVACGQSNLKPAVAISMDAGATWRTVFNGTVGTSSSLASVVSGAGILIALTDGAGQPLLMSFDGGDSWQVSTKARPSAVMAYGGGRFAGVNGTTSQYAPVKCLTYNTATQFAVPPSSARSGSKQFIKALS